MPSGAWLCQTRNHSFTATKSTYTADDVINGGNGTDVLNVTTDDDITLTPTVVGVETVNFTLQAFSTAGTAPTFEVAANNISGATINVDLDKAGSSVASATVTGAKSGIKVVASDDFTTAVTVSGGSDNEALTATAKAAAITVNSAGTLTAATITSTSTTTATLTTDSDASATLTTTAADMVISAASATTVVATSAGSISAQTATTGTDLTAATSVTLTATDEVAVGLDAAVSATISAGGTTNSTIDAAAGDTLTTLTLSGNGSAHTFDITDSEGVNTITVTGSQNVGVIMSAADIDGLTGNKVTFTDSSTGTSTLTVGTAAGDMDLTAAAADVIKLAFDNATKTATFASGAALTISADQAGGTLDGVDSTAASNTLAITLFDGTLSTTPTAAVDLNGVTITDFANVTIDGSTDDTSSTITALTASADNTNVTYNAGAKGVTLAGTSTLGTGALTINSTAAIAMGASVLTAGSLTTVGSGAVTWTALDTSKLTTMTTDSGADAITVSATNGNLTLNTGAGNDTVTLAASTTAAKTYTINMGDGALDTVKVNTTVNLTSNTALTLSGVERIQFDTTGVVVATDATVNNEPVNLFV